MLSVKNPKANCPFAPHSIQHTATTTMLHTAHRDHSVAMHENAIKRSTQGAHWLSQGALVVTKPIEPM
jgi:hypothetical protein